MAKDKTKRMTSTGRVPPVRGLTKKSVKIEFVIPDDPPLPVYANQMIVQSDGQATYLSFFLAKPPVFLGEDDDVQKKFDELQSLKAHMVAQVVVPQDRMGAFMKVLNDNFEASAPVQSKIDSSQDTSR
jgi:hypothetical protein